MTGPSSIRSPLGKARGLGSAKDGVHHWWMQRLSALALMPLILYFIWQLPKIANSDYNAHVAFVSNPFNAVAIILFVISGFYHAALGLQVIIEDYVHEEGTKFLSLAINKIFFFFLGVASIYAVFATNFGYTTNGIQ